MAASGEVRSCVSPALPGAPAEYLGQIAMKGGPETADYDLLSAFFRRLACAVRERTVTRADARRLLANVEPAAFSKATMQGLVLAQMYGYPGDFEVIDRIYNGCVCADPALAGWDLFFHAQPAIRALRNAKDVFRSWLSQAEARCDASLARVRLLWLGGGPGRELLEYFADNPGGRVLCTYIDADPRAVSYATGVCAPVGYRMRFQRANPLGFQTEAPHLIWASGLFDHLTDLNLVSVLRRLWHLLSPGGKLVSGCFSRSNPSRDYLDLLGWRLHHRDPSELVLLARQAGVPGGAIEVLSDPEGVYLFLHLDKRHSR